MLKALFTMMFFMGLRIGEVVKSAGTKHTVKLSSVSWVLKKRKVVGMKLRLDSRGFRGVFEGFWTDTHNNGQ